MAAARLLAHCCGVGAGRRVRGRPAVHSAARSRAGRPVRATRRRAAFVTHRRERVQAAPSLHCGPMPCGRTDASQVRGIRASRAIVLAAGRARRRCARCGQDRKLRPHSHGRQRNHPSAAAAQAVCRCPPHPCSPALSHVSVCRRIGSLVQACRPAGRRAGSASGHGPSCQPARRGRACAARASLAAHGAWRTRRARCTRRAAAARGDGAPTLRGVRGWRSDRRWQQGTRELRTEWELGGFALAGAPVAVADRVCIESLAAVCTYVRICQSPYISIYIYIHTCAFISVHTHKHTHPHRHTDKNTRAHTHTRSK